MVEDVFSSNQLKLFEYYPVLKKINNDNNGIIVKSGSFKKLEAGQYISSVGRQCTGIIFVVSGTLKIQRVNIDGDETNLYNISKGDFCHEAISCIMNCEPLNIVAKALTDTEVFIVDIDITKSILLKDINFLENMYKDIFLKFKNLVMNKETIIHDSLEKRIINLLMNKKSKTIYITHNEIAFEVDSTRESISRKLKMLEKDGYIKLQRGKIIILKDLKEIF